MYSSGRIFIHLKASIRIFDNFIHQHLPGEVPFLAYSLEERKYVLKQSWYPECEVFLQTQLGHSEG